MRVAIVHDYLVDSGGGERVVLALHELFPDAPIFTSVFDPRTTFSDFRALDVRPSFLQRLPVRKSNYKFLLPFYPRAFERFDFSGFDVILSSASAFAKGVIVPRGAPHICYCHTPTRFIWRFDEYIAQQETNALTRLFLRAVVRAQKKWDHAAAQRVDHFISNSQATARRIKEDYQCDSTIIPPPVDVAHFSPSPEIGDYYLVVSRLAPYKRIDIAVHAFNQLKLPLKIVGAGVDEARLRGIAQANIEFLGHVSQAELAWLYARARALIFPGEEDFGITPLEANASGRPVIAYAASGALDTVIENVTGNFFREQTPAALAEIVATADISQFDSSILRAHAEKFSQPHFKERIREFVNAKWRDRQALVS
ncbi:MAG: glycosyltransferase [Chloroflexi bacterium]|nr:glycosyltransferase [Chloroflexota bacterium]